MPLITPDYASAYEGDLEKELAAQPEANVARQEIPTAEPSMPAGESPEVAEIRRRFSIAPTEQSSGSAATPQKLVLPVASTQPPKSQWHQAGSAPVALVGKKEPAPMSGGEVASEAWKNLPSSLYGAGKAAYQAVRHPIDTASAIADVGGGAVSQLTDYLGFNADDKETKAKKQAAINVLEEHYKNAYGSLEGFKRALAKDPAGIIMDASTVLGGAGLGVKLASKAGLASKTGAVARAGEIAAKASEFTDPISLSLKAAKGVVKAPVALARAASAGTSGMSVDMQKLAAAAGSSPNKVDREAFRKFSSGNPDPVEYLDTAERAITAAKSEASSKYLAGKSSLVQGPVDISAAEAAIANDFNALHGTGGVGGFKGLPEANKEITDLIDSIKNDPARQGPQSIDALKQQIGEMRGRYQNGSKAQVHIDNAYKAVKNDLVSHDSGYASLMDEYNNSRRGINDAKSALGAGNNAAAGAALKKALRNTKTASGKHVLEEMAKHEPTLPFMLAGAATNPLTAGAARGIADALVAAGMFSINPLLTVIPAIGASPRIVGNINYGAGRAAGVASRLASPATKALDTLGTKGAYYTGTAKEETEEKAPAATSPSAVFPESAVDTAQAIRGVEGTAQNPNSSAKGAYQLIDSTFIDQFKKAYPERAAGMSDEDIKALRKTPEGASLSESLGPNLINENTAGLQRNGFEPTPSNVYLSHFLGLTGALRVLSASPDTPIEQVVSAEAVSANPELLQGKTAGEVIAEMSQLMARNDRMGRSSGGQVSRHNFLVNKLLQRAKLAKTASDKATEPLLNAPDHAVVKALDIAQQAI